MADFNLTLAPGAGPSADAFPDDAVDDLADEFADSLLIADVDELRAELRRVLDRAAEAHSLRRNYQRRLETEQSAKPLLAECAKLSDDAVRFLSAGAWTLEEVRETLACLKRPRGNPGRSRTSNVDLAPLRYAVEEVLRPWWQEHGSAPFRPNAKDDAAVRFVIAVAEGLDPMYTDENVETVMANRPRT